MPGLSGSEAQCEHQGLMQKLQLRKTAVNSTKRTLTVEGILQGALCRRIPKFNIIICPPGNALPIQGNQFPGAVDDLIQAEGVFRGANQRWSLTSAQ